MVRCRRGTALSDRIRLIDALRGLSLAGIAIAHFGEQYLGFPPPPEHQLYAIHGTADGILEALSWIFIRGKGFGIFSFMFGLSFVLQMQRAERRPGADFRPRFAWRLVILFAIGWLHGLVYSGDILTVYAALGIPLLLFYRVPDRWLIVLAVLLLVGTPRIAQRLVQGPATPAQLQALQTRMNAEAEEHWRALTAGDVPAIARLHATTGFRGKWEFQFGPMGRGYQTFGLFLLGLWAGRRRVLENVETHRRQFVRLWRWTGALSLLIPLVAGGLFAISRAASPSQPQPPPAGTMPDFTSWPFVAGLSAFDAWNNAMTLFYVASFALLFLRERCRPRLLRFAPVGQMALSVYVGQTVVGAFLFFGFGLGLLGRFGNSVTIPLGLALFAAQVWAARAWLARFRFGPLEWAWRSLTWLRREPIVKVP